MQVICVANQKGGVGKTTISYHLAWMLQEAGSRAGLRVLAIDMDASGNLSSTFKKADSQTAQTIFQEGRLEPVRIEEGLDLVPAGLELVQHDVGLTGEGLMALRRVIEKTSYDFVIIDSPPSLGRFLSLCLAAADIVLVPIHASLYALEGMRALEHTLSVIRDSHNPNLRLLGYVVNRFERTNAENDALAVLKEHVGSEMILGIIPKSIKVEEALRVGRPIWKYDPRNPVSKAYLDIALLVTGSKMGDEAKSTGEKQIGVAA